MTGSRIHLLRYARCRTISQAVISRTQVGSSLQHLARNTNLRCFGIVTVFAGIALGAGRTACLHGTVFLKPIRSPLPDVAGHVVESIAVGREESDGRSAFKAVH